MLLIRKAGDKEFSTLSIEQCEEMFKIPSKKLFKQPEFVINPKRQSSKPGQSHQLNSPAGTQVPANMFVKMNNVSYEIRYAETINPIERGDKWVDEYFPRKVQFLGTKQLIDSDNADKIIYMFLYPLCAQSPFRNQVKEKAHWMFKDIEAQSIEEMSETKALMDALNAINSYSGEPLRIIAKAFGESINDDMEDVVVQSMLVKIAQNPRKGGPVEFNKTINSQSHLFKGLALNGIDRGLFILKTIGSSEFWAWGKGPSTNKKIVDVVDNGAEKNASLLLHISQNIQEFYPILMSAQQALAAQETSETFLEQQAPIDLNAMFGKGTAAKAPKVPESNIGGGSDEVSDEDITGPGNEDFTDTEEDIDEDIDETEDNLNIDGDKSMDELKIPAWMEQPTPAAKPKGTTKPKSK